MSAALGLHLFRWNGCVQAIPLPAMLPALTLRSVSMPRALASLKVGFEFAQPGGVSRPKTDPVRALHS
jgi:hypothetical protein